MDPKVSIIMGSTSDLPVMEKAAKVLNDFCIPFEINALSAHRTPAEVESFAKNAQKRPQNPNVPDLLICVPESSPEPEWPHTYRV